MSVLMNKKVTYKRVRPNALFEHWLTTVYEEAKAKNSKIEPKIKVALESLSKYPIPLKSGSECMILKGFGKELCKYIDLCLETHNSNLALSEASSEDRDTGNTSPTSSSSVATNISPSNGLSSNSERNENYNTKSVHTQNSVSEDVVIQPQTLTYKPPNSNVDKETVQANSDSQSQSPLNGKKSKRNPRSKKYKPAYRSGGYAILHALLDRSVINREEPTLTKEQLIEKAQKYSEESFVRAKPDSFYTAWSNMSRLINKGLVRKIGKKKIEYVLTVDGLDLIKEILEENRNRPTVNDIIFNDVPSTSRVAVSKIDNINNDSEVPSASQNRIDVFEMSTGSFDIVLLIDKNETGGKAEDCVLWHSIKTNIKTVVMVWHNLREGYVQQWIAIEVNKKNDPTVAQFNKYPDLKHEYRSLKVGDFTWIARDKQTNKELVLPFVVERKRMDDLGASIKDGRFHEQKFRLRKCGLKNVIYLVENYGKNKHVGLPIQNLMQALANTRVQDGFKVHITDSLTNTARFLAMMTKRLTIRYKDKHLKGHYSEPTGDVLMTFDYFNERSAKTKPLTVTETFIKLLLQLKGVSVEKALAVTKQYPTPRSLIVAYSKCDAKEGEYLLANLKYGDLYRNVGPITSKSIYQLFSSIK